MDDAREVVSAARDRARALASGDAVRLEQLLHERFTWTSHVGETFDRSEYVRRNTEGGVAWLAQDLVDPEVVVVGDTAVLRAEVADQVRAGDGDVETFRMPVTQVWVRAGDAWVCLAGHVGPRLP